MNNSPCIVIVLFSLLAFSCEEVYTPKLENVDKVLIIEGLITDEAKPHTVKISTAAPFTSFENIPESGATVYVTDNHDNKYYFFEGIYGTYTSHNLTPVVGNKYILTVETKDKKIYKSAEQELLSKGNETEVDLNAKIIDRYEYKGSEFKIIKLKGAEFITSLNLQDERNPYYRYNNTILVEYTELPPSGLTIYSWKKFDPNEIFNINDLTYNNSEIHQHDLGFFPLDTVFYNVVVETHIFNSVVTYTYRYLYTYIVSIKQYHINKDVHEIYKNMNKQLEAEQHIFDPIATQVMGNITCVSDPKEKIFGLFEVASVKVTSYKVNYGNGSTQYLSEKITPADLDNIPEKGSEVFNPPYFWFY